MSCEKASRRLRSLILKARRLGVTAEEVAALPTVKKLAVPKTTSFWSFSIFLLMLLGASILLILICAPCLAKRATRDIRVFP